MESVVIDPEFWCDRRVFVTGHTGFKGGWLSLWLQVMGAEVYGYALEPPTELNLFSIADVPRGLAGSRIADIRDAATLRRAVQRAQPEIVFHLAAQPLVRRSYADPAETYAVNVMGTVHLLEAARAVPGVRAIVNVTTDKCYENGERRKGYREDEPLGGADPYSSSKACAELVTAAYRRSFLGEAHVALASARAGNVIGGGDWAQDRLVPDVLRAIDRNETLKIRYPDAVRPWQHVLEPLSGYLALAQCLYAEGADYAQAWNFGPADEDACSVRGLLEQFTRGAPELRWQCDGAPPLHEASYLKLDSSKAHARLGWRPRWRLAAALDKTLAWHRAWRAHEDMHAFSLAQVAEYWRT